MVNIEGLKFPKPEEINFGKLVSPDRTDVGLCPAIIRQEKTGKILGLVFMDEVAYRRTTETAEVWNWSREKPGEEKEEQHLHNKGETSGNRQYVKRIRYDCDKDSLLIDVESAGPFCHKGPMSCFGE